MFGRTAQSQIARVLPCEPEKEAWRDGCHARAGPDGVQAQNLPVGRRVAGFDPPIDILPLHEEGVSR
eukprot:3146476-Lingulodinium_polyedra.AAC.1